MNQISIKRSFNIRGNLFLYDKPLIMGILNMTPDSFYDGGKFNNLDKALIKIENMIKEGASIIDIGGCSTRPGSDSVSLEEEWNRIKDVLYQCKIKFPNILISVDTFRSEIAKRSLEEGVHFINDISGGSYDNKMYKIISRYKAPYILMHIKGTPKNMMEKTSYEDLILEILNYLLQ